MIKNAFVKFLSSILSLIVEYYLYVLWFGLMLILFIEVRLNFLILLPNRSPLYENLDIEGRKQQESNQC